mmetsp:Transcript_1151/g.2416  ORF Transcript_1151/g.2416 Transcript_1151/m.2416 type:complete len:228 (-) Transcript_1151:218-901(-)
MEGREGVGGDVEAGMLRKGNEAENHLRLGQEGLEKLLVPGAGAEHHAAVGGDLRLLVTLDHELEERRSGYCILLDLMVDALLRPKPHHGAENVDHVLSHLELQGSEASHKPRGEVGGEELREELRRAGTAAVALEGRTIATMASGPLAPLRSLLENLEDGLQLLLDVLAEGSLLWPLLRGACQSHGRGASAGRYGRLLGGWIPGIRAGTRRRSARSAGTTTTWRAVW